jgi:hypothetical protein
MPTKNNTPEPENEIQQERCGGSVSTDLLSDLELLTRQAACVEHLAEALGEIARMQKDTAAYHAKNHPGIIRQHGAFTAAIMESLGNALSTVDAITEEDCARWNKTFKDAQARDWISSLNEKCPSTD